MMTRDTDDISSAKTCAEIVDLLFIPEELAKNYDRSKIDDRTLANCAINQSCADEFERNAFGLCAEEIFDHALKLAKHFLAISPGTMQTDEPALIWASPYDYPVDTAEEYAFVRAVFTLQNDEAAFAAPFEPEHDAAIVAFLDYAKGQMTAYEFSRCFALYMNVHVADAVEPVPFRYPIAA